MQKDHCKTVCDKTGIVTLEIYYRDNRRHRDPVEGPALVRRSAKTGIATLETYYRDNKRHREPAEGPALVRRSAKTGDVSRAEYWVDGKLHRDPKDGPAVIVSCVKTGEVRRTEYWVDDRLHRDPEDGPAVSELSACKTVMLDHYFVDGRLHRKAEDGPAMVFTDRTTGIAFDLRFFENDKLCTRIGPSTTLFDAKTGELISVRFESDEPGYVCNHRGEAGPSMMTFSNGKCTEIHFERFGRLHRENGPALICLDPETDIIAEEGYYQDGRLHRALQEGPAATERDPNDGRVVRQEFHLNGVFEPPPERPADSIRRWPPLRVYHG
jgi:hypothetical protein